MQKPSAKPPQEYVEVEKEVEQAKKAPEQEERYVTLPELKGEYVDVSKKEDVFNRLKKLRKDLKKMEKKKTPLEEE